MVICRSVNEIKDYVNELINADNAVGFVPTMGCLHEGHLALVREAKKRCRVVLVSIFVNPTQFGPKEDFERYPRDPERDLQLLLNEGVNAVFMPEVEEIYPPGHVTYINLKRLTDCLCGASRPGHFEGVATVVAKLFNIIRPNKAFFGQKDAQQVLVIKRMVRDLNMEVEIVTVPIVRERDGLAMSSRNIYLSAEERKAATVIYKAITRVSAAFENGERKVEALRNVALELISSEPMAKVDYVEIRSLPDLEPVDVLKGGALFATAVYFGRTRLIDNVVLGEGGL